MNLQGGDLLERLLPPRPTALAPSRDLTARWGAPPDRQTQAGSWLTLHGLPSPKDEWWRYAELDAVLRDDYVPAARPPRVPDAAEIDRLAGRHPGPRLVFVDGTFMPSMSDLDGVQPGLWCTSQTTAAGARLGSGRPGVEAPRFSRHYDGFQALNDVAGHDGAHILLDADTALDEPVTIIHVSTGGDGIPFASHPRTTIEVEQGARATIIEAYIGLPAKHLANARTAIRVGVGAHLTRYRVVNERADSVHIGHTRVTQAEGSTVRSWSLLAGAAVGRDTLDVNLRGAGASVDLEGLYLPVAGQRHDIAVTVEHRADDGTSRQRYRGVIDDHARGSFSGRVIVDEGTTGNDAGQLNRCLLLSETAEADSRPWLEIFADDVRCTHGATVGQLDDDALFYLRSRGIPLPDARQLLIGAFVDELLCDIDVPTVRATVADILNSTGAHC